MGDRAAASAAIGTRVGVSVGVLTGHARAGIAVDPTLWIGGLGVVNLGIGVMGGLRNGWWV